MHGNTNIDVMLNFESYKFLKNVLSFTPLRIIENIDTEVHVRSFGLPLVHKGVQLGPL